MKNSINSAKTGNKELINLLIDVANENNVDIQEDSLSIIHDIILEYKVLCEHLRKDYVVGDLVEDYKKLLIMYYEGRDTNKIKQFLKDKCYVSLKG